MVLLAQSLLMKNQVQHLLQCSKDEADVEFLLARQELLHCISSVVLTCPTAFTCRVTRLKENKSNLNYSFVLQGLPLDTYSQ